jgi:hypothetical protein
MDDGIIALQFMFPSCANRGPQIAFAHPVRRAIDGPSIAKNDCGRIRIGYRFQFALNMEYCPLRSLTQSRGFASGKTAAEDNAGRFRQYSNVLAKMQTDQLQNRGLPSAGPAGQDDTSALMWLFALA